MKTKVNFSALLRLQFMLAALLLTGSWARAQSDPDFTALARRETHDKAAARLEALEEDYWTYIVKHSPTTAFALGLPDGKDVYFDPSPGTAASEFNHLANRLLKIEAARKDLNAAQRVDLTNLGRMIRGQIRQAYNPKSAVTNISGYVEGPDGYMTERQTHFTDGKGSAEDWEKIAQVLDKVPDLLSQGEVSLRTAAMAGIFPPKILVQKDGMEKARAVLHDYQVEFPKRAEAALGPDHPSAARVRSAGEKAGAALAKFAVFLGNEILPYADDNFSLGADETQYVINNQWGLSDTPQELRERLVQRWDQVNARIDQLEKNLSRELLIPKDQVAAHAAAMLDGSRVVEAYQAEADRAEKFIREKKLFDLPEDYKVAAKEMPAALSGASPAFYYPALTYKDGAQGAFFVAQTQTSAPYIKATTTHEALPGHDIQNLEWRRTPDQFPCYRWLGRSGETVEGWAQYATDLMLRHGFFDKKEEYLDAVNQRHALSYALLDLEINSGSVTVDRAVRQLIQDGAVSANAAMDYLYRLIKWPLQNVTYFIGQIEIEDLKKEYQARKGAAYSEAEFHREFLARGPMPISLIRRDMLAGLPLPANPDIDRIIQGLGQLNSGAR